MTQETLKRFANDYNLPIQFFDEKLFGYFMNTYDDVLDIASKYNMLQTAINKCGSEHAFLEYSNNLKNSIIDAILETDAYKQYNDQNNIDFTTLKGNVSRFALPQQMNGFTYCKSANIFNTRNAGKEYISIDLRKANFQAMKYYNKDLVFNAENYEDMIGQFTDLEYFKKSKHLRQVIFGNLNASRQIVIEKYITYTMLMALAENCDVTPEDVLVFTTDEIVLRNDKNFSVEKIREILNPVADAKVEKFLLVQIANKDFYVKEIETADGIDVEFKKVPRPYFAQVFKKYFNKPITDEDKLFVFEGHMAMLKDDIFE